MFARLHICPEIGSIMLKDLKTKDIQELVTLKFTSGRIRQAGGLSARTVKYIYQTIHSALEQAVKERVLLLNPAKHVELPKQEKKEMRPFTKEELSVFFEACEENRHFIIFFLAVATGMRRGEVFGLTWDNVNFETGTIEIKKQLIRSKDHGFVLKDLKTKKSKRALKVTADVLDRLKNYKREGLSSEKMKQKCFLLSDFMIFAILMPHSL